MSWRRSFCIEIIGWSISFMDMCVQDFPQVWKVLSYYFLNSLSPSPSRSPIILIFVFSCFNLITHISLLRSFKISVLSSLLYYFKIPTSRSHLFFLPYGLPCYSCSLLHSSSHPLTSSALRFVLFFKISISLKRSHYVNIFYSWFYWVAWVFL